jgi:hypothetical protein
MEKEARTKKMELSKYCAAIIEDYVQGRLVKENQSSEMEKLRMEKLKEEIRYLKIKNDFAENFDKPLSNSASRLIKPAITTNNEIINGVSPYDANNKRLQCTDCGVLLMWVTHMDFLTQIKEYKNHILSRHNRDLSPLEKDVIDKLKFEGRSK